MDTKLLTYAELAQALGIAPASAKRLAIRRGWAKTPGNDGKARVAVPIERLEFERSGTGDVSGEDANVITGDTSSDSARDEGSAAAVAAILGQHIERLGTEIQGLRMKLDSVESERDAERARAAQVEVLNAILEVERRRAEELLQERDGWQKLATAPRGLLAWLRSA